MRTYIFLSASCQNDFALPDGKKWMSRMQEWWSPISLQMQTVQHDDPHYGSRLRRFCVTAKYRLTPGWRRGTPWSRCTLCSRREARSSRTSVHEPISQGLLHTALAEAPNLELLNIFLTVLKWRNLFTTIYQSIT